MRFNKEILLALLAMTLLGTLIGLWWQSVYYDEVDALKTQTDIVFFRALEKAENNMVLKRSRLPLDQISHSFEHIKKLPNPLQDTVGTTEMVVIQMRIDSSDENEKINVSELFGITNSPNDTSTSITISVNSEASTVTLGDDGTYIVDLDSAQLKLSDFFNTGLEKSDLSNLKFKVLKKGMDSSFNAAFITQKGKVGNTFLDGGEFIAAVNYPPTMIYKKMIPEISFGSFLFLLVGGAFFIILKSLKKEKQYAQLKDDFVSNMTHELKTPISVVNVAMEALSDFNILKNKKKSEEYLSISKRELSKLDTLVDQILTINDDKNDLHSSTERINIARSMDSILGEFDLFKSRIDYNCQDDKILVDIAEKHFQSSVTSIIDNAFKYGSQNGKVQIELKKVNTEVLIHITNEGTSFTELDKDRIFDKFYRIPNQDIHDVKGHGLGLYYAKKHITAADGNISVSSSGSLCTIIISLPITQ